MQLFNKPIYKGVEEEKLKIQNWSRRISPYHKTSSLKQINLNSHLSDGGSQRNTWSIGSSITAKVMIKIQLLMQESYCTAFSGSVLNETTTRGSQLTTSLVRMFWVITVVDVSLHQSTSTDQWTVHEPYFYSHFKDILGRYSESSQECVLMTTDNPELRFNPTILWLRNTAQTTYIRAMHSSWNVDKIIPCLAR